MNGAEVEAPGAPTTQAGELQSASASGSTPRRAHRATRAMLIVLALALAGAAWLQVYQHHLLTTTQAFRDEYFLASLQQLETEYLRLREELSQSIHDGQPTAELQTRYDVFVSRVTLLERSTARRLIDHDPELRPTPALIRAFVDRADLVLGPDAKEQPSSQALAELKVPLWDLGRAVRHLTIGSAHEVAREIAERNTAIQRNNQVGMALTALLTASVIVFAFVVLGQMRQLEQRRRGLEELNRRLREARREAEAAADAKAAFLANMSHELRTPFQGLLGMLGLLHGSQLSPQQHAMVETANHSARHLLTVLNDILDMSKLEAGSVTLTPQAVRLDGLLAEVESLMTPVAQGRGLRLVVEGVDLTPGGRLQFDPTRVRQILYNLLNNAIKFCDAGEVRLKATLGPQLVTFEVSDTGIGIDEATQAQLFQRFVQADDSLSRRHGGAGLGLEISRRLARQMGGDITVRSKLGEGSVFTFTLPRVETSGPDEDAVGPSMALRPTAGRRLRVLVADDHAINRQVLAALLDRFGHAAAFVEDGGQAVEAVRTQPFDLVLMDLHMPVLDGAEAAARIRALPGAAGRVPIVAVTADVMEASRERVAAAGMDDFLSKPVEIADLAALLARHAGTQPALESPQAGDGGALVDEWRLRHGLDLLGRSNLGRALELALEQGRVLLCGLIERPDDDEALARQAHQLNGAASNLGLKGLAEESRRLEDALQADGPLPPDAVGAMRRTLAQTESWLEAQGLRQSEGATTSV